MLLDLIRCEYVALMASHFFQSRSQIPYKSQQAHTRFASPVPCPSICIPFPSLTLPSTFLLHSFYSHHPAPLAAAGSRHFYILSRLIWLDHSSLPRCYLLGKSHSISPGLGRDFSKGLYIKVWSRNKEVIRETQ